MVPQLPFYFNTSAGIRFGVGSLQKSSDELIRLLGKRIMVVSDKVLTDLGLFEPLLKEINILGRNCYQNLTLIEEKIDMVDIFRAKEFVFDHTKEAIRINANIIWMQEGIIDEKSSSLAMSCGIKVVMDECPKKVLES